MRKATLPRARMVIAPVIVPDDRLRSCGESMMGMTATIAMLFTIPKAEIIMSPPYSKAR